jgi:hypothetical protein
MLFFNGSFHWKWRTITFPPTSPASLNTIFSQTRDLYFYNALTKFSVEMRAFNLFLSLNP